MSNETYKDRMIIRIGDTFSMSWPVDDADAIDPQRVAADLTGWSARCEVKDQVGGTVLTKFHQDRSGHADWPGVITFDSQADGGSMTLTLDATHTAALSPIQGAVFDIELLEPTTRAPHQVVHGKCHIVPEVTTDA